MLSHLHTNILKSPYRLLPHAVFVFVAFCFLLHPVSPLMTGQLSDPDDYMRLNEVIGWLQGQSWFDLSVPRMSPDAHTVIHWSRLVDLPIALMMLLFIHAFGLSSAAMIASWIVPSFLFGLLLWLASALAGIFVGKDRANLTSLLVLFAPMVLFNFTPGRVDHHGYQILIAGFGVLCLTQILQSKQGWRYAIATAIAFACGLWIGTEALPWLMFFIACAALCSAWNGGFALRNAAVFGGSFAVATTFILVIALPASEFSSRALSWFSPADVILGFLTSGIFLASWLLGRLTDNKYLRVSLVTALGLFAALIFIWLVPDILQGPFADYDRFNSTVALDNITEAMPLGHAFWIDHSNPLTWQRALNAFIHSLFLPLLALGAIGYNCVQKKNKLRQIWSINGVFLLTATLLTLFWQVRVGYFMELFALAPLTWLLATGWEWCGKRFKKRQLFWSEIFVFLVLGPLPVLLLPALFDSGTLYRDVVLFPAARSLSNCNLKPAAEFLGQKYGQKNITLMSGMNEGPELLFRTPYKVIGGNFNVPGNPDVFAFFSARTDSDAQKILRKWHVNSVMTCRNISPFMAGFDHPLFGHNAFLQVKNGKLHLASSIDHPSLIEKLVNGKAPNWLKPIEIPGNSDYLLFEVQNEAETQ